MVFALRTLLRGISQVFFLRSAPAGALILAGLALASPHAAAMVLLGAAVQTAAAWVLGPRELVADGLMGYNGALVGAASSLSMAGVNDTALSLGLTLVGALACFPVHRLLLVLFAAPALRRFELPVVTAPFCLVAGLLFGVLQPIIRPGAVTTDPGPVHGSLLGLFNSFAEVMVVDGPVAGAVILAGLLLGSWAVGLWAGAGAVLALVLALLLTGDMVAVSTGLLGYSAVLVAIALGHVFTAPRPVWRRGVEVLVGVALAVALRWLLDPTPFPTYTWPFILGLWIVLVARRVLTGAPARSEVLG